MRLSVFPFLRSFISAYVYFFDMLMRYCTLTILRIPLSLTLSFKHYFQSVHSHKFKLNFYSILADCLIISASC